MSGLQLRSEDKRKKDFFVEKARSSRRTDGPPELGAAGCGFWVRGERRSLSLEPGDFHIKPACTGPPADFCS
ncbi:hypothetical protein AOLI_G00308260 [Acnodon oligacanthus]